MKAPMDAALPFIPPIAPSDPTLPGPFAFADANHVRNILSEAGFGSLAINPFDTRIGGADLEQTVALGLKVGPLGAAVREHPEYADRVRKEQGGHSVPLDKLQSRFPRTQLAVGHAAPLADMTLMFDNSRSSEKAFALVRAQRGRSSDLLTLPSRKVMGGRRAGRDRGALEPTGSEHSRHNAVHRPAPYLLTSDGTAESNHSRSAAYARDNSM
jgi:hypothetical protein